MTMERRICILGGDARMKCAAERLRSNGHRVTVIGEEERHTREELFAALSEAEVLLLPPRFDASYLSLGGLTERSECVFEAFGGTLLLCGAVAPWIEEWCTERNIRRMVYTEEALFALRNALPSAEGAIYAAMRYFPRVLAGAEAVILGYGRIGELLADRLHALGAHVCIAARRREALEHARLHGYEAVPLEREALRRGTLPLPLRRAELVFNTVPVRLLGKRALGRLRGDVILIELASLPGGFDPLDAELAGMCFEIARGLPGRYAPITAGEMLAITVEELMEDLDHESERGGMK